MDYSKEELSKIRHQLPKGSAEVIATRLKLSTGTVRNILSGQFENDKVIAEALVIIEESKKLQVDNKEKIASL